MFYSYNQQYPISYDEIPNKIRFPSGLTKTNKKTFTDEDLKLAGYEKVDAPPEYNSKTQTLYWSGNGWTIENIPLQEIEKVIRRQRDALIESVMWRYQRYEREIRMGKVPVSDDIEQLDRYVQALADISLQENFPYEVNWPAEDLRYVEKISIVNMCIGIVFKVDDLDSEYQGTLGDLFLVEGSNEIWKWRGEEVQWVLHKSLSKNNTTDNYV
jgi:hypothetical protein